MPRALPAQELLTLRDALLEADGELASLRLRSLQMAQRMGTAPAAARKAQHKGEGAQASAHGQHVASGHQANIAEKD